MSSKADRELAWLGAAWRVAIYVALAGIAALVAWLAPGGSQLELVSKVAVLLIAFLFLYPYAFKSRPASRSF